MSVTEESTSNYYKIFIQDFYLYGNVTEKGISLHATA